MVLSKDLFQDRQTPQAETLEINHTVSRNPMRRIWGVKRAWGLLLDPCLCTLLNRRLADSVQIELPGNHRVFSGQQDLPSLRLSRQIFFQQLHGAFAVDLIHHVVQDPEFRLFHIGSGDLVGGEDDLKALKNQFPHVRIELTEIPYPLPQRVAPMLSNDS